MSRHRNIRTIKLADDIDGYDDVYGHSVEDEHCISPSDAAFMYDRTRQPQISQFINKEKDIAEENEDILQDTQPESFERPKLNDLDEEKLRFCVDEIQNVIGDMVPLNVIEEVVLNCNFNVQTSLHNILDQTESSNNPVIEEPKPPRERKQRTRDRGPRGAITTEPPPCPDVTVTVVSAGAQTKGFEIQDFLKPSSNVNSPRCQSPASGRVTPQPEGEKTSSKTREIRIDAEQLYKSERGDRKQILHMVVIGHVDAGKSTLMGHLLWALGQVNKKTMHKYEQESKKMGKQSFMYAWILDETGEERSRGITMDIGQSQFETKTKTVNLLDAPGHKDFIPNMITGATQADVAVLVVDATRGEFETGFESGGQTREHALLVRSLGVSQLAVVVNKLDTVGWSEDRFKEITSKLGTFLKQAGYRESDVTYVPCSGLTGENLIEKPSQVLLTGWYNGPCLLEVIDNFKVPDRPVSKPLRVSVNDVYKGTGSGFCVSGRVETGMLQSGDKVLVLPQNQLATVKGISIDEMPAQTVFAGDHVSLTLANYDIEHINIGYILCDPASPVAVTSKFEARIVVFNINVPITKGYPVVLHSQSLTEPAVVVKLVALLNKNSGEVVKKRPRCLVKNSNALVQIETSRPICLELYKQTKELGRFMLRVGGVSIAAGLVTNILGECEGINVMIPRKVKTYPTIVNQLINLTVNNRFIGSTYVPIEVTVVNKQVQKLSLQVPNIRHLEKMSQGTSSRPTNRLALEKSPYLLQHSHNPVDWYPWGKDAFTKAQKENKLIFLSVGYSTCHWCHVMERESFENEEIAKIMNDNFVCVKVDREERPDVDKLYMTFVQVTTGGGGWPMSVWLTPGLEAVFGGTYFPPNDEHGRPGFKTILSLVANQWRDNRNKFSESGQKIMEVLREASTLDSVPLEENPNVPPGPAVWDRCFQQLSKSFEPRFGGFSDAPKFPQPVNLNFLLYIYCREPHSEEGVKALEMCTLTLQMMAKGGIHDHIAQGFARYSTDEKWHVPHFEKMLYDQAQLAVAYSAAYLATKDALYADIVEDIITYVNRDLSHPSGGFYSAEDADSLPNFSDEKKREGAFCVWTAEEVKTLLDTEITEHKGLTHADVFSYHYDVQPDGNVNPYKDPHHELRNQNVLIVFGSEEKTANKFDLPIDRVKQILRDSREKLYSVRQKRPRPHLDDKMLTAWNGLMISGLAKAGQALANTSHIQRAIGAAKFVRRHLYLAESKTLLRSCYKGQDDTVAQIALPIGGFLDDYAFLIRGLLDLYEASFDVLWLEWAETLQDTQDRLFWDEGGAGYFTSPADDSSVVLRMKEDQDGAEPSGNSVAVHNLLRLSAYLSRQDCKDKAGKILSAFSTRLVKVPVALPEMASGLILYHDGPLQIFVTGKADEPETAALLDAVQSWLLPGRVLALADGNEESTLYKKNPVIQRIKPVNDRPAAYVCRNHTCSLPVTTREELLNLLDSPKTSEVVLLAALDVIHLITM